jgi:hypothetical protein
VTRTLGVAAALLLTAGCAEVAHQATVTRTAPSGGGLVLVPERTAAQQRLFFRTPDAAMRRMTAAWNAHDDATVKRLVSPEMRPAIDHLHTFAVNLSLDGCHLTSNGTYYCRFAHDLLDASGKPVHASNAAGHSAYSAIPDARVGYRLAHVSLCGT